MVIPNRVMQAQAFVAVAPTVTGTWIFFNDDGVRPLEQLEAVFLSGGRVTGLRLDKQYPLELNGYAGSPLNPWDQA